MANKRNWIKRPTFIDYPKCLDKLGMKILTRKMRKLNKQGAELEVLGNHKYWVD